MPSVGLLKLAIVCVLALLILPEAARTLGRDTENPDG
jgi:hypothetical protein